MAFPQPLTYDRAEVLHFSNGTTGVHCVKAWRDTTGNLPQPTNRLLQIWQDLNPDVVAVSFAYSQPRCELGWVRY